MALEIAISATFSELLQAESVTPASFTISPHVAAHVVYEERTATFYLAARLALGTTYTVTLSTAVKDSAGNALAAPFRWTFTARTPGPSTFASMSVGGGNSCALSSDGTAYCWGPNDGQIGDGTRIVRWNPVPIGGGKNGTPVWYLMAKDEGHGFAKKKNVDFLFYSTVMFVRQFLAPTAISTR